MALDFNDKGREMLFNLSGANQKKVSGFMARYNTLHQKKKEDTSALDTVKAIPSAVGQAAGGWWDRYKARVNKNQEKHGYVLGSLRSVGETYGGIVEGAAVNLPGQIGAGLKNLGATKRSIFNHSEVYRDGDSFLAEQRRKRDMKKVKDFVPTAEERGSLVILLVQREL